MRVGSLSSQNSYSFRDMIFLSSDADTEFKNENPMLSKTTFQRSPPKGRNGTFNKTHDGFFDKCQAGPNSSDLIGDPDCMKSN